MLEVLLMLLIGAGVVAGAFVGLVALMLFAAGVFATADAVLNVLSTISVVDIYQKNINPGASDRQCLRIAKILTVGWGLVIIGLAFSMINIQSILETIVGVSGILVGPIVGVFMLGMFVKRANWQGTLIGLLLAFGPVLYLKFGTEVTFTLYGISGVTGSLVLGVVASLFFPPPPAHKTDGLMTWKWRGLKEMLLGGQMDPGE